MEGLLAQTLSIRDCGSNARTYQSAARAARSAYRIGCTGSYMRSDCGYLHWEILWKQADLRYSG